MQKIVQEVLQAEEQAKNLIDKARQEATLLKNNAEQEIAEKTKIAREQAQEAIKSGIQKAREEALAEHTNSIAETEKANALFITENTGKIAEIVQKVAKIIITPEIDKE